MHAPLSLSSTWIKAVKQRVILMESRAFSVMISDTIILSIWQGMNFKLKERARNSHLNRELITWFEWIRALLYCIKKMFTILLNSLFEADVDKERVNRLQEKSLVLKRKRQDLHSVLELIISCSRHEKGFPGVFCFVSKGWVSANEFPLQSLKRLWLVMKLASNQSLKYMFEAMLLLHFMLHAKSMLFSCVSFTLMFKLFSISWNLMMFKHIL